MIARRRGSAIALNASVVVAARAMSSLYAHIGICQGRDRIRRIPQDRGPPRGRLNAARLALYLHDNRLSEEAAVAPGRYGDARCCDRRQSNGEERRVGM
jgi:hypothetical protein